MKKNIFRILNNIFGEYYFAKIKRLYLHLRFGKIPRGFNFKNPKTFNEKINYLKLFKKEIKGSILADKIDVKEYVKKLIGDKYLIPTIGTYNSIDEIDWDILPNSFVMKATHSSGMNFLCSNKNEINKSKIINNMKEWLKSDYAKEGGEWQYNLIPRIICEEYLENTVEKPLLDYKFFCFKGKVKYIQVDTDRFSNHSRNFYDKNWELQPFTILYSNTDYKIKKPNQLINMIEIAEKLSKDREFLRIDLYNYNNKIYFGEITFHPGGGCEIIEPYNYDLILGEMIEL